MNLNKSTRYALYAAMEMALAGEGPVTVTGVAERYGISKEACPRSSGSSFGQESPSARAASAEVTVLQNLPPRPRCKT